jgi:pimeloyl-ACP methyl ester carboxylesterase
MTTQTQEPEGLNKERVESTDLKYGSDLFAGPDGTELYYELRGRGPQITIVNNFFIISPLWRNFTRQILGRHRLLTYDLRNQGASSPAAGQLHFSSHVQDLTNLLDFLGIEKTYLVGTSISTLICRDFALAHPERVKGLVLVGPVFCPFGSKRRKYLTKSWLNSLENGGPGALFDHIYPLIYSDRTIENGGTPAYLAIRERFLALNSHEQVRINLSASLTTDDDPAKLRNVRCPTLLLAGDGDFLSSPTSLEATARIMPDARVQILPFAGHVPYFEATAAFENSVLEFLAATEARS